jgi:N-acetylglucosaminyldiphosphoundecaprenol N-acetyl-beta-D-mannosaminyltransferase
MIDRIASSKADIVWVGLSTPKQERWMAGTLADYQPPVLIGVGAAFDMHAGVKKQAPRWMQRSGLEWLFRLATEPRRLWRRYLANNPRFVWRLLLQVSGAVRYDLGTTGTRNLDAGALPWHNGGDRGMVTYVMPSSSTRVAERAELV